MFKKLVSLIFIFAITIPCILAQRTTLSGKVICKSSGSALEYATVALFDTSGHLISGSVTAADGTFSLSKINPGKYRLVISFLGYEKIDMEGIVIDRNQSVKLGEIALQLASSQLNEVQVTGEIRPVEHKIDRQVVNVAQQPNAAGGSVADILQNVPSVKVDADGNVTMRGSTGFTLLIDGRPSVTDASESLKSIPAESVEKVEIITNPSARYDATGVTGIINVITKKKQMTGTDGLVSATAANGDKYTGNIKISQRFNRVSALLDANYSNKWQHTRSWSERLFTNSGIHSIENISENRTLQRADGQVKLGTDITLPKKNSLSMTFQAGSWKFLRRMDGSFQECSDTTTVPLDLNTLEEYSVNNTFLSGDLFYMKQFRRDGHTFSVDIFDSYLENNSPNTYEETESGFMQQIDNYSFRNNLRVKADYALPITDTFSLAAGLQADLQSSLYHYDFLTRKSDSTWIRNDSLSGLMDYHRSILAGYFTFSGSVFGISFQAGIRAEQTLQNMIYTASTDDLRRDYFNLFPSFHLGKEISHHQFGLSYSRRINRPTEWQLSPLLYASDRFFLRRGNPNLQPEYLDAIEFSYTYQLKKFDLNAEVYARKSRHSIHTMVLEQQGIFYETYENLEHELNAGTDIMTIYKPWKWLRLELGVSIYYSQWNGTLSNNEILDNHTWNFSGNFKPVFYLTSTTDLTFQAIYYAPSTDIQGYTYSFYYFDFTFRQQFLKKKLIFTLRTHNTFNTGLYHFTTVGDQFSTDNWYRYEGPVIIAGLAFKINSIRQRASPHEVRMDFDSGLDR